MTEPSKLAVFAELLDLPAWPHVHLDGRHPDAKLPPELVGQVHVVLQYGRNLPIPITDLRFDEHGISATLSFGRVPFATYVPWAAVFLVEADGRGRLWREAMPAGLKVIDDAHLREEQHTPAKRRNHLKLVD